MNGIITIPKGKNILDFLHELDGSERETENEWFFMRSDVVRELKRQCGYNITEPVLPPMGNDGSFALCYGDTKHHIGVISLRTEPCCDSEHRPVWAFVTTLLLDENSPVKIAFRQPSLLPRRALFLILEA